MKRALITGIHGFTGHYLAQSLRAAGYRVFGTALSPTAEEQDVIAVDLGERDAVLRMVEEVQPDVVVHLAAIAFVAHSDIEAMYRVNLMGTRNLLEALAALANKPSAVLLASSANIYGNADVEPISEVVAPAPANDYAVSKLAMEYMARLWMDRLPITIVRPFNYTGVGQHENFLLPKIVSHFKRGARDIELGNLHVWRDFSDVRMVVDSYSRLVAAGSQIAGQTFNVCSGNGQSLGEALDMMAGIAGYRINVTVNPAFVRSNEVTRLVGSNAKLQAAIGPLNQRPLAETLRWMYES
ncbi:GDP-mannose 4,6-dehydratase [Massilia eburnea]|uniref:GDP-mannose 4,6-dehydratase n=1 Tax=Massilia eburnea TaxID=1776165 RepID=UPI003D6BD377